MEGESWCQFPLFLVEIYGHLRSSYNIYCASRAGDAIQGMIYDAPEYPRHRRDMIHLRRYRVYGFIFSRGSAAFPMAILGGPPLAS